jgi:hypothetical protein
MGVEATISFGSAIEIVKLVKSWLFSFIAPSKAKMVEYLPVVRCGQDGYGLYFFAMKRKLY